MYPTLIIGLGGTGSRVTADIYKRFMAGKPTADEQSSLVCLCFDSDPQDINVLRNQLPDGNVVKISEGRQVGELEVMDRSIERLAANQAENVQIHIICSLAGNTGARLFLQYANRVRNAARALGIESPQVTGFFILGDVFCKSGVAMRPGSNKGSLLSDTYINLKALRRDSLYDLCYLMGYGKHYATLEGHCSALAEFVYHYAVSPLGESIRTIMYPASVWRQIQKDSSMRYATFGLSKLAYPIDGSFREKIDECRARADILGDQYNLLRSRREFCWLGNQLCFRCFINAWGLPDGNIQVPDDLRSLYDRTSYVTTSRFFKNEIVMVNTAFLLSLEMLSFYAEYNAGPKRK